MIRTTLTSFKRGFTMLELVFVIVILGIVASIASSLIVQVYESYIVQRALHRTSAKAELAAMQIANRLTYRISSSVIGKKPNGVYLPLDQVPDDTYTTLEWIGYDNDSFTSGHTQSGTAATRRPGWSGFCDVNASAITTISTPGSDLGDANAIIGRLSSVTGAKTIADAAIVFAGHEYSPTKNYIANCMGFTDSTCISPVSAGSGTSITVEDNNAKVMTDQYKLAWSAYAVVPEVQTNGLYTLKLKYNYQPWDGDSHTNAPESTLVDNVESFRFIGKGDTVRFKICVWEDIGDMNVTSCKEKAVIR